MLQVTALVSGGGSTLKNLLDRIGNKTLEGVDVVQVIASRTAICALDIAAAAQIPAAVVATRDYPDPHAYSTALTSAIEQRPTQLVVMAGFLSFWHVPPHWTNRVINIHPALLPAFGGRGMYGLHVHRAVLAAGVTESGCTVHLVDNQYDHGPIVAQRRVAVLPSDTPESLAARVQAAERELYPAVLQATADEGVDWLVKAAQRFEGRVG